MASRGIVERGVLLDIAHLKGKNLEPGTEILLDDLIEAEKSQNVNVKSGDFLFVRTGTGRINSSEICSGLHPQCIPWIYKNEISLLGADGVSDIVPNKYKR